MLSRWDSIAERALPCNTLRSFFAGEPFRPSYRWRMPYLLMQLLAALGVAVVLTRTNHWLCQRFPRYGSWVASLPEW